MGSRKVVAKLLYLGWIKVYMVMIIFACKFDVNGCVLVNKQQGNTEWLNSSCCCAVATIVDGIIARIVVFCHGYGVTVLFFVVMFVGQCKRGLCIEAKTGPLIDFWHTSYMEYFV